MYGFDLHMPEAHNNLRVVMGPKTLTCLPGQLQPRLSCSRLSYPIWSHREKHSRIQVHPHPPLTPPTPQRDRTTGQMPEQCQGPGWSTSSWVSLTPTYLSASAGRQSNLPKWTIMFYLPCKSLWGLRFPQCHSEVVACRSMYHSCRLSDCLL